MLNINKLKTIGQSKHLYRFIFTGKTHDTAREFFREALIAGFTDKELVDVTDAALPPTYSGDFKIKRPDQIKWVKENGIIPTKSSYNPGSSGPIPLGYTKEGSFILKDQSRGIILSASHTMLFNMQYLLSLCDGEFWKQHFPSSSSYFSSTRAGETLIKACKEKGRFNPTKVRGPGIWQENGKLIINLGKEQTLSSEYHYISFHSLDFDYKVIRKFEVEKLVELLDCFNWKSPEEKFIFLGWLFLAPICGVLQWRPHVFLKGPKNTGKSTLLRIASDILKPLRITIDGQSTEAGIRQALGGASIPVIIDEFETDQEKRRLDNIIKLARSASSAESPVLRGTPEGKALEFSIRTSFLFAAINKIKMRPADQSRIIAIELIPHDDNLEIRRKIFEGEKFFRNKGSEWCNYSITLADMLEKTVEIMEDVFPTCDSRHRLNMSTILGTAFLALNARIPSKEEAAIWLEKFQNSIEKHQESHEADDAFDCLQHLLRYVVKDRMLGETIKISQNFTDKEAESRLVTRSHGIILREDGFIIANKNPAIEKIYSFTSWEGIWPEKLGEVQGAHKLDNPQSFSGIPGKKSRGTFIPYDYLEEFEGEKPRVTMDCKIPI